MELDDLKKSWIEYDKKLSENLKLNETLLRKINLNNSKKEFQKPLNLEIVNIVVAFLAVVWVLAISFKFIEQPKFSMPGLIAAMIGLVYLTFSIIKVNRFTKIDYYQKSVVNLQKDIAKLNQFVLKIRKVELILMPFLISMLFPILFKAVHNMDIYKKIWLFVFEIVFVAGIGLIVTIWINKKFVDKKMKNVDRLLDEIANFEKE